MYDPSITRVHVNGNPEENQPQENQPNSDTHNVDDEATNAKSTQTTSETSVITPSTKHNIVSAFKVSYNKLGIKLRERKCKFEAFKRARGIEGLYCAERLIHSREDIMHELRIYRNNHTTEKLSVFTRNGVPMIQFPKQLYPTKIKCSQDLAEFKRHLPMRTLQPSEQRRPGPNRAQWMGYRQTSDDYQGLDRQHPGTKYHEHGGLHRNEPRNIPLERAYTVALDPLKGRDLGRSRQGSHENHFVIFMVQPVDSMEFEPMMTSE